MATGLKQISFEYSEGYSAMKSRWTAGSTLTPGPMVEERAMLFT